MSVNLKLCLYGCQTDGLNSYFNKDKFCQIGFDIISQKGEYQDLFAYLSRNKVDILIFDATDMEKQRSFFVIDIIYNNFCKNILVITEESCIHEGVVCLSNKNKNYFDLELNCVLFRIKKEIESKPYRNMHIVKSKICNILLECCFSSKNDGFNYFVESIYRIFLNFPYKCRMMQIYEDVGKVYNKSRFAVEKSMRQALLNATKRASLLPATQETQKIKSIMTYDMNNKLITNTLAVRLAQDKELLDCIDDQAKALLY